MKLTFVAPIGGLLAVVLLVHCGGDEPASVGGDASAEVSPESGTAADDGEAGEPPPPPTDGSGTRFRRTFAVTRWEDGTEQRVFADFWDKQANEPCYVGPVGNDVYACLRLDTDYAQEVFSDAACTMPVLMLSGSGSSTRYLSWGPSCARKFGRRGTTTKGNTYRKNDVTGNCESYGISTSLKMEVPEEIPPSAMGIFKRRVEQAPFPGEKGGSRLVLESDRFESEDGAFVWRAPRIVDTARKSTGIVGRGVDGAFHFFTSGGAISDEETAYRDPACTQKGVVTFFNDVRTCRNDPFVAKDGIRATPSNDPACYGTKLFARPASEPVTETYISTGNACALFRAGGSNTYSADPPAPEVPYSELATLTRDYVATSLGGTPGKRLDFRAERYSSSDGFSLRSREPTLWLRDLDLPCELDGTQRCQPKLPTGFNNGVYLDDACTDVLLEVVNQCGDPVPTVIGGGSSFRTVPPEAIIVPSTVYRTDKGTCTPGSPPPGYVFVRYSATKLAFAQITFPKTVSRDIDIE